jgi:hypothetical protein
MCACISGGMVISNRKPAKWGRIPTAITERGSVSRNNIRTAKSTESILVALSLTKPLQIADPRSVA